MLSQLVGFTPVERAIIKSDVFFLILQEVWDMNEVANHSNVASLYIKASTGASESLK